MKSCNRLARVAALALLVLVPLAFSLGGCTKKETTIVSPTDPTAVLVFASGACEPDGSSINCLDNSRSDPAGKLSSVTWTLRRGNATEVASKNADPGATVSFGPNLAAGTYTVEQKVTAKDGASGSKTYPNIQVL